jgi:hypothetical protein
LFFFISLIAWSAPHLELLLALVQLLEGADQHPLQLVDQPRQVAWGLFCENIILAYHLQLFMYLGRAACATDITIGLVYQDDL